jgi:hypothetical protein
LPLKILRKFLSEERGSVESSLVLIPLLTLFLISAQLSIAVHGRNMEKVSAQDEASSRAISGEFSESDTFLHIDSSDPNQNLDLVISYRSRSLPKLLPGITNSLGGEMRTDVSGIALIENQR